MEYNIKPSVGGDYILLTIVGDFTAMQMMGMVIESHSLGVKLGIHDYLVDSRQARNVDTSLGNYNFAYSDMKLTEGVDPKARVAVLASPGDHSHDFAATVSANAGMSLKIFNDLDAAIDHLKRKI